MPRHGGPSESEIIGGIIGLCIVIIVIIFILNKKFTKTGNYIIVKDKYVYQYFEPKPTPVQSKVLDKRPKCGLDLLNLVVKYYVVDTHENKYEITESEYNSVQVGRKFKVRTV